MKKSAFSFALILMVSLFMVACTSPTSSLPASSSSASVPSNANSESSIDSSLPAQSSSVDSNVEKSITGMIDDFSMGKIYVRLEDGLVLDFNYTTADLSELKDSRPGNEIILYYTGEIKENDTSNTYVTRIVSV